MIIWFFSSDLNGLGNGITFNPVFLCGYDQVGNLVRTVHLNDVDPTSITTAEIRYAIENKFEIYFADGYSQYGDAITCTYHSSYPPAMQPVRRVAIDSAGRVYCAMKDYPQLVQLRPGVTADWVWQKKLESGWVPCSWTDEVISNLFECNYDTLAYRQQKYVDFFRVYRQNGDRIHDYPRVHGRPIYAVAVDSSDNFYIAGDPEGVNEIFLRKFNSEGAQQWETALAKWWTDATPYWVLSGITHITIQWYDFTIFVDAANNVYVSGHRCYSSPTNPYNPSGISMVDAWIRKYNSSGVLQWERRFPENGLSNIVTDGAYIYVAHHTTPIVHYQHHITYYKIGDDVHYFNENQTPIDISVWDSSGNVVKSVATPYVENPITYLEGTPNEYTVIFYICEHYGITRLAIYDGNLYCSSLPYGTDGKQVYIFDTATLSEQPLNLTTAQYLLSTGGNLDNTPTFVFDTDGNQYCNGTAIKTGGIHFAAYTSTGVPTWNVVPETDRSATGDNTGIPYGEYMYSEHWDKTHVFIQEIPQLPAIRVDLSISSPTWGGDRYSTLAGLPLCFAMGTVCYRLPN